jgi:hypothetical protein
VIVIVGLYLVLALEASGRVRGMAVAGLCVGLLVVYLLVLLTPGLREFFELAGLDPVIVILSLIGAGLSVSGLWLTDERFVPWQGRFPW